MSHQDIEQLLDRYLRGETNSAENDLVEKWLSGLEPEDTEWKSMNLSDRKQWESNLFNDVQRTINSQPNGKPVEQVRPVAQPIRIIYWKKVAAIAAVLAVFLLAFLNWPTLNENKHFEFATTARDNPQKKFTLPDGSVVWINSFSELKYPRTFDGKTREVYLTGEAYFDIHHDTTRPFIVHTGTIKTTVLGTAFNVNALKDSKKIIVTVTRGKVSVADQDHLLGYITPNQQLTYNTESRDQSRVNIDAEKVIAWQGDLFFDNLSFSEVASVLQQRFDVKIGFENERIKDCRFSGTASKGNNLEQILKIVCAFNNASYKQHADGSIIIYGSGCN
jgi:transmembrane sensor